MITVDPAAMATELGVTENQVATAIGQLETALGYPLLGTAEPEARSFPWQATLWHKVQPLYDMPTSVVLSHYGDEETLDLTALQLGQNGKLNGDWFNAFKLCGACVAACRYYDQCEYVQVTAKWGFAAPAGKGSDLAQIPGDLYGVLVAVIKQNTDKKRGIQSEGTGTRNYSKFTKAYEDVWVTYADTVNLYAIREQRHN